MKKIDLALIMKSLMVMLCLLWFMWADAQNLERYVISNAGAHLSRDGYSLEFTLGEPVAQTFTNGEELSQGFHQNWVEITAVDDPNTESWSASLYPNPSAGLLYIETAEAVSVKVIDLMGHLLQQLELNSGTKQLDIADLVTGMYMITLQARQGKEIKTFKIHKFE